jgi:hypothetical protein
MLAQLRIIALVFVAFIAAPTAARAQQLSAPGSAPEKSSVAAGPRLEMTATAARQLIQTSDNSAMQRRSRQGTGKPVALMIVGGAAIILGAVIGDAPGTLFMIGGAVALLIGLYQYLQ